MTAPSAPVIRARYDLSRARLYWSPVTGAATYNVYKDSVLVASGLTDTFYAVLVAPGSSLTVTAVNAGAEESAASNAVAPQNLGGATSFGTQVQPFGNDR